ncbi:MAG: alpha/beta hydrolase family protein [Planctomycetota bacterium]
MLVMIAVLLATAADKPPATVAELWADVDPRRDPLEVSIVRSWEDDGVLLSHVTWHVGAFLGKPARMAAFHGRPKVPGKVPGLLHLHGGGQRASIDEVRHMARLGYSCLSINWGGRPMQDARPGDANTDWGAVDPTQNNVPGYFNLKPGPKYLDPVDSPRNNNWYLLTIAARRGLTFLEKQPEVDPARLGVFGLSMGGNLTVYVAGSDPRVKASVPEVGGSGFRHEPRPMLPNEPRAMPNGSLDLFNATLGFESYAPCVRGPMLWLGATNDFHGIMDDTYRTGSLIPGNATRYAFTPHLNHRFTPEFSVNRSLWFDQHLKGGAPMPSTPASTLVLDTPDHAPTLVVTPADADWVAEVRVYYSVDADPRARFWRSAEVARAGGQWRASLPVEDLRQPLFAFANVAYPLPGKVPVLHAQPAARRQVSSQLHEIRPAGLVAAGVRPANPPTRLIDDFAAGWRDWYALSAENPHHWEYSTRKVGDSRWRGAPGDKLRLTVASAEANELVLVITENFFRGYRGKSRELAAVVRLPGGPAPSVITLSPGEFKDATGSSPVDWAMADILSLRAYMEKEGRLLGSKAWKGPQPVFGRIEWAP